MCQATIQSLFARLLAMGPKEIEQIWIHRRPDMDEIIALWLIQYFGQDIFVNAECVDPTFMDPGVVDDDFFDLLDRKILCLGFGKNNPFNEHPEVGGLEERDTNISASSLVATFLNIRNEKGVKEIVDYSVAKDNSTDTREFEIAPLVKQAYRHKLAKASDQEQADEVVRSILLGVFCLLEGFYLQRRAFIDCQADVVNAARTEVEGLGKAKLRIISVVSNNPEMQKFCRSGQGGGNAVIICRQKSGNTQIFFDHRAVDKDAVAWIIRELRRAECQKNGIRGVLNEEKLMADGKMIGAECWYYEYDKWLILNGSLTQSAPPTKLNKSTVELIVFNALNVYFGFREEQLKTEQK